MLVFMDTIFIGMQTIYVFKILTVWSCLKYMLWEFIIGLHNSRVNDMYTYICKTSVMYIAVLLLARIYNILFSQKKNNIFNFVDS